MHCGICKENISAYLDALLPEADRRAMRAHFEACRECQLHTEQVQRMRRSLRGIPQASVPTELQLRLRVVASREHARKASPWYSKVRDGWQLWVQPLLRPIALPLAGGLCSAVLLFSSLVPSLSFHRGPDDSDSALGAVTGMFAVPVVLSSEPLVKSMAPLGFFSGDAVVDLRIDEAGRIVNYSIVGADGRQGTELRRSIENNLLFTTFTPATAFGKPIAGTIRLTFRSSRIEVRG